jgi:hypothetical protein
VLTLHHLEPSHLIAPTDPVTPAAASIPSAAISRAPARAWTEEEDELLRKLVDASRGTINWTIIADMVPGRDNIQCRQRWVMVLDKWTPEEDAKLTKAVKEGHVDNWDTVASMFPRRTKKRCQKQWKTTESRKTKLTAEAEAEAKLSKKVKESWQAWDGSNCASNSKPMETTTEECAPPDVDVGVGVGVSPQQPTKTSSRRAAAKESRAKASPENKDASDDDDGSISEDPTPRKARKRHTTLDTDAGAAGLGLSQSSAAVAESDSDSDDSATSPPGADSGRITDVVDRMSELSFSASNIFGGGIEFVRHAPWSRVAYVRDVV